MITCTVLPLTERLRHLIQVFGSTWMVLDQLNDRVHISSMDGAHIRYIDTHQIKIHKEEKEESL